MRRLSELMLVAVAVCGLGCPPVENPTDGGVDAGPEVCVTFPERFPADTTVPKGCYLALKSPVISAGVTVTLLAGTRVVFSAGTEFAFTADQALTAVGTADEPIVFTGAMPTRGFWKGLAFENTSRVSTLAFVTVEYAGDTVADRDAAAVKLTSDSRGVRVAMTNSTLRESEGWGLWANGAAVISAFANNTFTHNTLGPASLDAEVVGVLDVASVFSGNDVDRLFVRGMRVSTSATWPAIDVPYFLSTDLAISTADLTLAPGVSLVMAPGVAITVSSAAGALIAAGTAEKPILFTGATQTRGAWEGIVLDGSNHTRNVLRYATIEYAGNVTVDRDSAALKLIADSRGVQLRLDHVTLRQSQGWGLFLTGSAVLPEFTGNVFTQNALGPALVDSNVAHLLDVTSTYTGNDVDKVAVQGNAIRAAVTWKALGVPYHVTATIDPDLVWTIAPGVTLEMAAQTSLRISGDAAGLHAVGTPTLPIVITGLTKTRGSWDGIMFDGTLNGANAFEYCTIEYGGGGGRFGWNGMINAQSDSHGVTMSVTNSTVQHSLLWGIWVGHYGTGSVSGNTYADNAGGDYFHAP